MLRVDGPTSLKFERTFVNFEPSKSFETSCKSALVRSKLGCHGEKLTADILLYGGSLRDLGSPANSEKIIVRTHASIALSSLAQP